MVFDTREKSIEDGQPIEVYEFTVGVTKTRYTSSEDEISFNGQLWQPRAIKRTKPEQTTDEKRQDIKITLPTEDVLAQRYIGIVPGQLMALQIVRFHRGDTTGIIIWDGAITGAAFVEQATKCVMQGLTTEAAFSRAIPRFKYQGLCNHILYDDGCTIDRTLFDYVGNVSAISGNDITVDGIFTAHGADWATGGYVSIGDDDFRLVMAQSSDVLTILLPFGGSLIGTNVTVYAGCAHTLSICQSKFANEINYGGFAYVPGFNVFSTGLN